MRSKGVDDLRFFAAFEKIPRHHFVAVPWLKSAYDNKIIPIECGEYIERLEEQLLILAALSLKKTPCFRNWYRFWFLYCSYGMS